jgi:hypothetical protein
MIHLFIGPGRRILRPATALIAALLAGCAAAPLMPTTDYDRTADFSAYSSFQWLRDDPLIIPDGRDPEVSPLNVQRIMTAIDRELAAKGYHKAPNRESADFVVSFTVGTRDKIDIYDFPPAYNGPWYWHSRYWGQGVVSGTYREGTLAIDVFDQRTRAPVWHGRVSKRITSAVLDDTETAINEAVSAILAEFPPG